MTLGKPCKGQRFIARPTARGKQPDTFVPTGNSESTINLNFMCLECEKKQANPVGVHSDWGKHANSKQTEPDPVGNQTGPSSCEAQEPTIAPWWLLWWILGLKYGGVVSFTTVVLLWYTGNTFGKSPVSSGKTRTLYLVKTIIQSDHLSLDWQLIWTTFTFSVL